MFRASFVQALGLYGLIVGLVVASTAEGKGSTHGDARMCSEMCRELSRQGPLQPVRLDRQIFVFRAWYADNQRLSLVRPEVTD